MGVTSSRSRHTQAVELAHRRHGFSSTTRHVGGSDQYRCGAARRVSPRRRTSLLVGHQARQPDLECRRRPSRALPAAASRLATLRDLSHVHGALKLFPISSIAIRANTPLPVLRQACPVLGCISRSVTSASLVVVQLGEFLRSRVIRSGRRGGVLLEPPWPTEKFGMIGGRRSRALLGQNRPDSGQLLGLRRLCDHRRATP